MSAPSDKNILLSSTEAAEIAGVTSGYITRVCREGKLKGVRRDASWFVERAELEIYLVKVAAEKKVRAEKLAQERAAEYYANVPKKSSRRSPTLSRTMAVSFATLFLVAGAVWAEGTLVTPPVQKQTTVASALASAPSLELNVLGVYDTLKEWFLHPVYRFVQRVVPTRTPGIAEAIATPTLETKTIIERITERVIERTPVHMTRYVTESVTINGITEAILNERLLTTRNQTTEDILKKINDRNYSTAGDSSTSSGNLDGSTITNATFSGTSVTTNTLTATNATTTNLYTTGFGIGLDYLTDITGYGLDIQNGQLVVTLAASPFATSTADSWFTSKDTDDLAEGSTNLYFTNARARSAFSSTATGLTYTSGTGALSLTAGYTIPLTASTTAWNTFYDTPSSRITAGTGLSWSGNTLNVTGGGGGGVSTTTANTWSQLQTFTSGINVNNETFTDLTGAGLQNLSGVLTLNTTGDWTGTFDGQEGSFYLARANHTGTQLASTISDFTTTARGLFSSTATGLTYTSGTGAFSLTSGYTIPLTASTTEWNTAYLNRITSATSPLSITNNVLSLSTAGDWAGLFDGQEGAYYLANSFSTTSANSWLGTKSTTDLAEGTNQYYTLARFASALAGTSTDALAEGTTNLYYTNARADARVAAATTTIRSMFSAGSGLTYSSGQFALNTTGDWTGLFDGIEGSAYLARANHTGTQLASTISDFTTTARGLFSSSATGLTYTSGTGALSLTAGYTIPLTASTTNWNTAFDWGNHASAGYLTNASIDTSSELAAIVTDETGTGSLVFNASPTFTGTSIFANLTASNATTTNFAISSIASSLLKTNAAGTIVAALAGTDYVQDVTGNWTGLFDGQEGTYYLARANHTGTQLASTISDFAASARGLFSSSATGLTYTSGTGALSLTAGYTIPLTASTTEWNTAYTSRIASVSYPLQFSSNVLSLAFGTTTANTWGPLQTFGDLVATNATTTNLYISGETRVASLTGLLKATAGVVTSAVAGTDYQAAGNYITALTGDITASGPGSASATLATVNANTGSFGSSTAIPTFTVNGKGLVTAAGTVPVIAPAGTLTGVTLASNILASSLTSVGTLSSLTSAGTITFSGLSNGLVKATSGVLSAATAGIDYENPLTFDYPLVRSTNAISLAFGTTTANTWGPLQTFGDLIATNATTTNFGLGSNTFTSLLGSGLLNTAGALTLDRTGAWTGTFDGQEGTWYQSRDNHSGTQLANTISDFATTARGLFSSSATGLTYTSGTGAFSLTAGYTIPLTASTTNWNTFYDTPSTRITAGSGLSWSANTLLADLNTLDDTFFRQGGNSFGATAVLGTNDSNNLAFETGGATRLTIDTSGNVGIGITAPNNKLHVSGGALEVSGAYTSPIGASVVLSQESTFAQLQSFGSRPLALNPLGNNVGIGTSTPQSTLDVAGNVITRGVHAFYGGTSNMLYGLDLRHDALYEGVSNVLRFRQGGSTAGGVAFSLYDSAPHLFLSSNGNVGVGTSTPLGALHIDKNNNGIAQALLTNENTGSGAYAEYSVKTSAGNTWLGATGANYVGSGGADVANRNYVWGSSSGGLDLAAVNAAANLRFFTGGVAAANERMIITSTGNVGIGTTTPAANLVVNGTTGQNLFQIATSTNQRVLLVNTNGQVGIGAVPVAYSGALQVRVNTDQNISLRSDATSGARIEAFNDAVSENIPLEFVSTRFNFLGGNVGIGTTTPTSKLDVMGSIGISPTSLIGSGLGYAGGGTSASFSTLQLYDGSTGFTTLNNEGYGINLQTAGTNRLTITNAGNVGIGTTTPNAKLQVAHNATYSSDVGAGLMVSNATTPTKSLFVGYDSAIDASYLQSSQAGVGVKSLLLNPSGGNVGIGTTTPAERLHVVGGNIRLGDASNNNGAYMDFLGYSGGVNFRIGQSSANLFEITPSTVAGGSIFTNKAFVVDNSGNVGIGNTNPGYKFTVDDGSTQIAGRFNNYRATSSNFGVYATAIGAGDYSVGGYFGGSNATYNMGVQIGMNAASNTWAIYSGGTAQSYFGGNVGIGTITPTARLTVMGGDVHIGDTNFLNNNNLIFYGKDGAAYGETNYIGFVNGYTPSQLAAKIAFKRGASSEDGTLHFSTRAQSGSLLERMSITETGNVGIGTTTPETRLDVNGAARFLNYTIPSSGTGLEVAYDPSGSGAGRIIAINRSASSFTELRLQGAPITLNSGGEGTVGIGTTNPLTTFSIAGNGSVLNGGSFRFYNADNSNFSRIESPASGVLSISTGGVNNALYVANSGNIGIGTTNPSVPLQVTGDVSLGGLNVTTNTYSAGSAGSAIRLRHGATSGDTYGIIENLTVGGTTVGNLALNPNGGNVGIGTASPGEKLEVSGNIKLSTSASYLAFGNPSTPLYLGSGSALLFAPDNNEQYAVLRGHAGAVLAVGGNPGLLLNASGNVGIGTTTPATSLSVVNSGYRQMALQGGATGSQTLNLGSVESSVGSYVYNNAFYATSHYYTPSQASASGIQLKQDGSIELLTDTGLTVGVNYLPTTRLKITNAGNVGIGTADPGSYRLRIESDSTDKLRLYNSVGTTNTIDFVDQGWQSQIVGGNGALTIKVGGTTTSTTFASNGNVSIGTTDTANYNLQVSAPSAGWGGARIGLATLGSSGSGYPLIGDGIRFTSTGDSYLYDRNDTAAAMDFAGGNIKFRTAVAGSAGNTISFSDRMTILNSNGNVGIGTTNPTHKLTIANAAATPTRSLDIGGSTTGFNYASISNTTGSLWWGVEGSSAGQIFAGSLAYSSLLGSSNATALQLASNGTVRMTFDTSGNVGIGTSEPKARLDLGSSGGFMKVRGSGSATALNYTGFLHNDVIEGSYLINSYPHHVVSFGFTGDPGRKYQIGSASDSSLNGSTTFVPHLTVLADGRIGIGTTNPAVFKLQVAGNVGPETNNTYDLGSADNRFRTVYTNTAININGYHDITNDNLLVNGDFETNSTTGWTGLTTVTTGGYSGNYTSQTTGYSQVESADYIPVNPVTDVLQLEGWFKKSVAGASPGIIYFGYIAYDANKVAITSAPCGTYCYFAAAGMTLPADGQWHKYSATTHGEGTSFPNFPVGTKYVRVLVLMNYTASSDAVTQMDHVTLKRVNNGPLFVGNNFDSTNLDNQTQATKLFTTSSNNLIIMPPSSGNVGIGTTNPGSALEVKRTASSAGIYANYNDTNKLRLEASSNGNGYIGITTGSGSLSIGNTSNADAIFLGASGNVGIGTASPAAYSGYTTLAINHATNGGVIDLLTNGTRHLTLYSGGSTSSFGTVSNTNLSVITNNAERMRVAADGNISVANLVSCAGVQTNGSGLMSCTSDENLKNTQGAFTTGLSGLRGINPQTYIWKEGTPYFDGGIQYSGFIAQNVGANIPEAMNEGANGYKQISTTAILAASVNAIKELDTRTLALAPVAENALAYSLKVSSDAAVAGKLTVSGAVTLSDALTAASILSTGSVTAESFLAQTTETLSEEVYTGGKADLYKMASFAIRAGEESLRRTDLIMERLSSIEEQLAILAARPEAQPFPDFAAFTEILNKFSIRNGMLAAVELVVDRLTVGSREKPTGITFYDEVTGEPYCLSIRNGAQIIREGECQVIDRTQPDPVAPAPTLAPEPTPAAEEPTPGETPVEPEPTPEPAPETTPEPEPPAPVPAP